MVVDPKGKKSGIYSLIDKFLEIINYWGGKTRPALPSHNKGVCSNVSF